MGAKGGNPARGSLLGKSTGEVYRATRPSRLPPGLDGGRGQSPPPYFSRKYGGGCVLAAGPPPYFRQNVGGNDLTRGGPILTIPTPLSPDWGIYFCRCIPFSDRRHLIRSLSESMTSWTRSGRPSQRPSTSKCLLMWSQMSRRRAPNSSTVFVQGCLFCATAKKY